MGLLTGVNKKQKKTLTLLANVLNTFVSIHIISLMCMQKPSLYCIKPHIEYANKGQESDKLLDIQIESGKVKKVLDKLRCDKAGGTDELSSRLLIELKEVICYPVTKIISEFLCTGIVPADWKTANVTPIFKIGSRQRVENYRPVSLTSLIGIRLVKLLFEMQSLTI